MNDAADAAVGLLAALEATAAEMTSAAEARTLAAMIAAVAVADVAVMTWELVEVFEVLLAAGGAAVMILVAGDSGMTVAEDAAV